MAQMPAILIVEDDIHIAQLITAILEEEGYGTYHAGTGQAALDRLEAGGVDLLILDWMLPDLQGLQVCRIIKSRAEHVLLPVLMLTARSSLADRVAGLDAGADDYLTKPFHTDELLARVRALLRIRAAEGELSHALGALAHQHQALKQAYDQLRDTQAQLVQTSRLAALGELVAGVAHELNNPLAVILGNAELIPELEDEYDRRAMQQIIAGAQRARRVVRSLMSFAGQNQMDQNWYHLHDLIDQVLDLKGASLRSEGVELQLEYGPDLPMLWVDGPQIQQVLLNLLQNAEYALRDQTDRRIIVQAFRSDAMLQLPPEMPLQERPPLPEHDCPLLVIDVVDNGPGIAPEVTDRLFEPFVTTKPIGQGTGLGLAISYGIVAQHNGHLAVASAPGSGAVFRLILPILHPYTALSDTPSAPLMVCRRVLVIDDEPELLELIERLLMPYGWQVSVVADTRTGLDTLSQQRYDVVLCDMKLPHIDGAAFYAQFLALVPPPHPRLVIMIGETSNPQTHAFLNHTQLPFLRKPFSSTELLDALVEHERANEAA